ncbi:stage III sporulation protein SpoIIIAB [Chengkuizengella axinellae]|uniref:Stage III sporulation protein SpoIIIAB n=1 Tax=Chengkuizengella axinellae TaxID=3064388 RepID=A0ABT9J278_9BACL|nr:stage III sporulation protein SpoIIIAB [Chengkuizengella sp. 2205SS18-9]MDP5275673.1 stage III sporulation protein SpoIIIAB [Chengkuizengella sp. 2205SS18-9]
MLNLIGAIFIIFSGTMIGFYQANQYINRPKQIRHMIHALQRLETEIHYGFTPLPDALEKISNIIPDPIGTIFYQIKQQLVDHIGATVIDTWQEVFSRNWRKTAFKNVEKEMILQVGSSLGISDREDQIKHLRLAITQLQSEEEMAKDEQNRYAKMWRSLGMLIGVLVVIIML